MKAISTATGSSRAQFENLTFLEFSTWFSNVRNTGQDLRSGHCNDRMVKERGRGRVHQAAKNALNSETQREALPTSRREVLLTHDQRRLDNRRVNDEKHL